MGVWESGLGASIRSLFFYNVACLRPSKAFKGNVQFLVLRNPQNQILREHVFPRITQKILTMYTFHWLKLTIVNSKLWKKQLFSRFNIQYRNLPVLHSPLYNMRANLCSERNTRTRKKIHLFCFKVGKKFQYFLYIISI